MQGEHLPMNRYSGNVAPTQRKIFDDSSPAAPSPK
jgi:hypothetical protein